jgi:hypothetical protein
MVQEGRQAIVVAKVTARPKNARREVEDRLTAFLLLGTNGQSKTAIDAMGEHHSPSGS